MVLAIHRTALDRLYGAGAWTRTEIALDAYTTGLHDAGIPWSAIFLDDPRSMDLDLEPAEIGDAIQSIAIVRGEIERTQADALLLIGGPDVVPMPRVPNQLPTLVADLDTEIPTDNLYGCVAGDKATSPSVAIGRIGGAVEDGLDALLDQLDRARAYRAQALAPDGALIVFNEMWGPASAAVAKRIPATPKGFVQTPDEVVSSSGQLQRSILFFNLHGSRNDAGWFGTDSLGNTFRCMGPEVPSGGDLSGVLVFACNCYGCALDGLASDRSIALAMVQAGVRGFVGATGYAFGATGAPGQFAFSEELARMFFDRLDSGHPAGIALCQARQAYAAARVRPDANRAYKTAMQFILLGDPLL